MVAEWFVPFREAGAWRCQWLLHGLGDKSKRGYSIGEDSTQALLLAMEQVRDLLRHEAPTAYWLGEDLGLGLPRADE